MKKITAYRANNGTLFTNEEACNRQDLADKYWNDLEHFQSKYSLAKIDLDPTLIFLLENAEELLKIVNSVPQRKFKHTVDKITGKLIKRYEHTEPMHHVFSRPS